ncbi:hypothetical protein [Corynebacterium ulcerans]|uniref:hypothetical protein n=1 Tax=Corynebacterium ulcerans TaxID=65058 RepID=UPI0013C64EED|nr:hypothetical protein [Corynebacterium ulcerans]NON15647.1 hypothetical protein [Corynebacterium ulcerans]CAB0973634.1 DNA-binding protein [Corynebacterium diphtheriae]
MDFKTWLKTLPTSPTPTIAGKHANLPTPTLLRHAERGYSTSDNVIKIARAYRVNIIDALVDNGFIEAKETQVDRTPVKDALASASITELLDALTSAVNKSGLVNGEF